MTECCKAYPDKGDIPYMLREIERKKTLFTWFVHSIYRILTTFVNFVNFVNFAKIASYKNREISFYNPLGK